MHEYSIVQSLLDSCEKYCQENSANEVLKVVAKIGEFSGVEPKLLKIAFDTFKENTIASNAHLDINYEKGSDELLLLSLEMR